jgi:hypothetical protein
MIIVILVVMVLIGSYLHDDRRDIDLPAVYHYLGN